MAQRTERRNIKVPRLGTMSGAADAMKLMGLTRLAVLMRGASDTLDGAVPALAAELEAGNWQSMDQIADFFPLATVEGAKVKIPLDGGYCVDLLVDCESQIVLIEYAGKGSEARAGKKGSKVA